MSLESFHEIGPHAYGLSMINMNNPHSEYSDDYKDAVCVHVDHEYDG